MRCEAFLPPAVRRPIVVWMRRPRRSWRGWLALAALVALNEALGLGVVAIGLKAWLHR